MFSFIEYIGERKNDFSEYVYNWISRQNHVKEESLTDWLLYEISQRCNCIYYQAFSRHEEAQNGSDWEWWILTSDSKGGRKFNAYIYVLFYWKIKCMRTNKKS